MVPGDYRTLLPPGTITFLFTDIEGSTRLWEEHPEAMREALARHDELLRQAIESHGGQVFKTVGDAFCPLLPALRRPQPRRWKGSGACARR